MTWFKVDDGWHKNRKRIRVGMDMKGFAARGLWVDAGSWASDELTDGWVPAEIVDYLAPGVGRKLAELLVRAKLWTPEVRDGEEGWQFHDWTDQNPTREEELAKAAKKSAGGALGNHRRWHVGQKVDPRCPYCGPATPERSVERSVQQSVNGSALRNGSDNGASRPSRPDPSRPDPVSSKSKSGGVDLSDPLTKQDQSEVSKPASTTRRPKTYCIEHYSPDDRDCTGCFGEYGDAGYWSKQPPGAFERRSAERAALRAKGEL